MFPPELLTIICNHLDLRSLFLLRKANSKCRASNKPMCKRKLDEFTRDFIGSLKLQFTCFYRSISFLLLSEHSLTLSFPKMNFLPVKFQSKVIEKLRRDDAKNFKKFAFSNQIRSQIAAKDLRTSLRCQFMVSKVSEDEDEYVYEFTTPNGRVLNINSVRAFAWRIFGITIAIQPCKKMLESRAKNSGLVLFHWFLSD
ncbi:hypothetical protein L596_018189 [Steinernema carpocapsae]|uniref:F-box domain-containing protein n=1 Tax=Steinernema carpocapsae TaxID=34508 RepID=A0A4U5N3Y4_STECR|nr:hypothetical protein L596_018189 [Steinernema carpocapsae]